MRLRITIDMLEIRNRKILQSKVNICKSDVKIGDYADSLVNSKHVIQSKWTCCNRCGSLLLRTVVHILFIISVLILPEIHLCRKLQFAHIRFYKKINVHSVI